MSAPAPAPKGMMNFTVRVGHFALKGLKVSAAAKAKIEAAGGKVEA